MANPTPAPRNGATPPRTSRMLLSAVTRGRKAQALRVLLYAPEGLGKSTFASQAPSPIFLAAEDGTAHLDVARFPQPESWAEVMEALRTLAAEKHDYRTVVLDTLDWLEPLAWAYICERDGKANIEEYGYGKGYVAALYEWRQLLAELERFRRLDIHVVLLAHSQIRTFNNPEGDNFDRYQLKVQEKAAGVFKEWCDDVLFANYETFAVKGDAAKRARGVSSGARLIYTNRKAAYDAKNRHALPESMPLNWGDYFDAVQRAQPADPDVLAIVVMKQLEQLRGVDKAKADAGDAYLEKHRADAVALSQLHDRLNALLGGREEVSA